MEEKVFLFQNEGDHFQHTVADVEPAKAEQLVNEGKAIKVSFGEYGNYRLKAQEVHNDFKKKEKSILNSDHPKYNVEGTREYELKQIQAEYDKQSEEIQSEYNNWREQQLKNARQKAASATIKVTEDDKAAAEQLIGRTSIELAQAYGRTGLETLVKQLTEDISYLSDAQKVALTKELPEIVEKIEGKARKLPSSQESASVIGLTKNLYSNVQDVRNMDLLSYKVADQLPTRVDKERHQTKTVKRAKR